MEYGIAYLKNKLECKRSRINLRYNYYDMKYHVEDMKGLLPENFAWLSSTLGWCAKGVDTLANRIVFHGFDNDDFYLSEIYQMNNLDVLADNAVLSALISSCSFIYIGKDSAGYPTLQVIDGGNATGIIDPITNMLTEGYAVLERDKNDKPIREAYFRPYQTAYYRNGVLESNRILEHSAPYALLVPIINRPDAKRPFGHSRISRCCIDTVKAAVRTIRRSEVCAEFYSIPQKWVTGLSPDAEFNGQYATWSKFMALSNDENGQKPSVGQFSAASMAPYIDQLRMFASIFAGETDLTIEDLGFTSGNPASYEAIKASHENLKLTARKAQRTFGTGFLNAGYLAACIRDKQKYERMAFRNEKPYFAPIFEPDAQTIGAIGDAAFKINSASEGYLGARNLRDMTGMESDAV